MIICHISRIRMYQFETDDIYRMQHIAFFVIGENKLSFLTEVEQLRIKKANLVNELELICRQEKSLKETQKILEEKMAVQELAYPPLPKKPLEWCSSPATVLEFYHK